MKILPWVLLMFAVPAFAQVPQPHMPSCQVKAPYLTKQAHGDVPAGVSDRYDVWMAWICEKPEGYQIEVGMTKADSNLYEAIVKFLAGKLTEADAMADCAKTCVAPTQPELDYMNTLIAQYQPRSVVAINGKQKNQPVFSVKTDGTVGPTVAGQSVAVAAPCDPRKRIVGSNNPNGTGLYSVAGQPNASQPGSTLGDVYAICTVSLPLSPN